MVKKEYWANQFGLRIQKGDSILDIKIVMRFHKNKPNGGAKIMFEYANYLVEKGHNIILSFVSNTPFSERKYNKLLFFKYFWIYMENVSKQKKINWIKLNRNIRIETRYSIDKRIVDNPQQLVIAFDYGVALSLVEHVKNTKQCVYLVQHDEKVYYSKNVVRRAWKLPIKKIVISTWLYKKINKVDPGNVVLIKNYVDKKHFYLINSIKNRKKIVSLIAHPNPYKGTKVAVKALKIVKRKIPDLQVLMFGAQKPDKNLPDYYKYFQLANESTLRNQVYNQSAVYVLPSVLEGWGLTATEAMACGCALVSTRNGGVEDFGIDKISALLCDVNDVNEMAKEIEELLLNVFERTRIAKNGIKKVNSLNFENSAELFEKTLFNSEQSLKNRE